MNLGKKESPVVSHSAKLTWKGHIDTEQVEKTKEFLRSHPQGVRASDVARYVGCSTFRVLRLIDILSNGSGFLVGMDDDVKPPRYFMYKDE